MYTVVSKLQSGASKNNVTLPHCLLFPTETLNFSVLHFYD